MAGSLNATPSLSVVIMGLERKHFNGLDFFYARRDYNIRPDGWITLLFICMGCSKLIKSIYLIGSMKNKAVPLIANMIEKELDIEAFCDWISPGEEADDKWREYEKLRGRTFKQSFYGPHTENVFNFDKKHLDRTDGVLLVMPGGKSAHLELGYTVGKGKPAFILFDKEPDRYDIMLRFANDIYMSTDEMIEGIRAYV